MSDGRVDLFATTSANGLDTNSLLKTLDQVELTIRASGEHAALALSLANLAARLTPNVGFDVPRTQIDVAPFGAGPFSRIAKEWLTACRAGCPTAPATHLTIDVGLGIAGADLYVSSGAWGMRLSRFPHEILRGVGPAVAACSALAAGEIFRQVIPIPGTILGNDVFEWNLLDYTLQAREDIEPGVGRVSATCYGAGSVGSSIAYALLVGNAQGEIEFVDMDHLVSRNRFRYPLWIGDCAGAKVRWLETYSSDDLVFRGREESAAAHVNRADPLAAPPIVVSAVDNIAARRDVTDALARWTINVGVDGLKFHVSRHGFGDGQACLYCPYVDVGNQMDEIAVYMSLTGLEEDRLRELLSGELLSRHDLESMEKSGRFPDAALDSYVGARLQDLARLRLYAQARVTSGLSEIAVSAPAVSALAGSIVAAELQKMADGASLPLVDRRVDVDLSGYPTGFQSRPTQDKTGRCLCHDPLRLREFKKLWGKS